MGYEPKTFEAFIGQDEIKRELRAMLAAQSKMCILLKGNYGSGKTTLAKIMGSYRGDYSYQDTPDVLNPSNENANTHIIDEIHLAPRFEPLYNVMSSTMFIFCTTERERLPAPFLSRCVELAMRDYNERELQVILRQKAENDNISIDRNALEIIATRSRNTPRTAIQLLNRVHNLSQLDNMRLNSTYVESALNSLRVYENGLIEDDRNYLRSLLEADDSPVSLNSLAAILNRNSEYIKDNIEYFLLYKRLILITPRGRVLTSNGKYVAQEMGG